MRRLGRKWKGRVKMAQGGPSAAAVTGLQKHSLFYLRFSKSLAPDSNDNNHLQLGPSLQSERGRPGLGASHEFHLSESRSEHDKTQRSKAVDLKCWIRAVWPQHRTGTVPDPSSGALPNPSEKPPTCFCYKQTLSHQSHLRSF